MAEKIIFNGRTYNSVSEMPPDIRQMYERLQKVFVDANQNGVPDIAQQGGFGAIKEAFGLMKDISQANKSGKSWTQEQLIAVHQSETGITINGKTFRSVDEMPDDLRQVYLNVVNQADPGSIEIYDEPWRERDRDTYFIPHDDEIIEPAYSTPSIDSVMEPVGTNTGLIVLIAFLVLLCIGLGAFLLFSRTGIF